MADDTLWGQIERAINPNRHRMGMAGRLALTRIVSDVLAVVEAHTRQAQAQALRDAARDLAHVGIASQMLPKSLRPRLGDTAAFATWLRARADELDPKGDGQ